jgi:hypothetical protein
MIDLNDKDTQALPLDGLPIPRKRGRPSTGKALSRADIQRQYRNRKNSNVTNNAIELLDENMRLRKQLLEVMDQVEEWKMKARVEFEAGEKARNRVRFFEKQMAAETSPAQPKASSKVRYVAQFYSEHDQEFVDLVTPSKSGLWEFKTKKEALAWLERRSVREAGGWRVMDRKTGLALTHQVQS